MITEAHDHLLLQVNDIFTDENRLRKLSEECLELSLAIEKFLQGRDTIGHIEEEMADVLLTMRGAQLKLGLADVSRWAVVKSIKLRHRLEDGVLK